MKDLFRKKIAVIICTFIVLWGYRGYGEIWKVPNANYSFECGKSGGKLILPTSSDPKSFNPVVAKETSTTTITNYIFEGLTRVDPKTLEVIPHLAKRWETVDGREWIFFLRDDVFWQDGVKFTASDVKFTFEKLIYNPRIPSGSKDIFTIEGEKIVLEQIDDYTIKFILPSVFAPFLRALSVEILPQHVYEPLVSKGEFTFSMGLDSRPQDIVGSGPFRLKSYLPGERVVLTKNQRYWKYDHCSQRLPYLDEIMFVILPNPEAALLRFLEGQIDYYSLRPQDLAVLGPRQKEEFSIFNAGISFGSNFLVLNQNPLENSHTHTPYVKPYKLQLFRNKQFRKAISYAIDRDKIIEVVLNGLGVPQFSPLSQANTAFYNERVVRYPYDPHKSKELLNSLGLFDRDGDGILEDQEGRKVEITLFTNADNSERITIATLVKNDLERVGIRIHFLPLDFNNLVTKLTATYDWEMILIGLTGGIEPYFGKNVWSYKGGLHPWNPTKQPIDEYEQTIDDIFNASVKTLDFSQRKALFDQWQYIVSDNLPFIYTVLGYSLYAVSNRFGNLYPTVYGGPFAEIEYIYCK